MQLFVLFTCPRICHNTRFQLPRLPVTSTFLTLLSSRSKGMPLLDSSSVTCTKELSWVFSRNLDCVSPAILPMHEVPSTRGACGTTGPAIRRLSPVVLRGLHLLPLLNQVVCSRGPLWCCTVLVLWSLQIRSQLACHWFESKGPDVQATPFYRAQLPPCLSGFWKALYLAITKLHLCELFYHFSVISINVKLWKYSDFLFLLFVSMLHVLVQKYFSHLSCFLFG